MTHDRWTSGDSELTAALRALYAAPVADSYWSVLEARILARVARRDEGGEVWWSALGEMMRPGLVAAAALILAAGFAVVHSRQVEARSAYASVISTTPSSIVPSQTSTAGDGDAAIHFLLSH
jgi:hypothetical protein